MYGASNSAVNPILKVGMATSVNCVTNRNASNIGHVWMIRNEAIIRCC